MSEDQVREQIKTAAVLEAFDRSTLSRLPSAVRRAYDDEDRQFDMYSEYTAAEVAKGVGIGEKKGLFTAALGMKKLKIPTDQIVIATGLSSAEVDEVKVDDQES